MDYEAEAAYARGTLAAMKEDFATAAAEFKKALDGGIAAAAALDGKVAYEAWERLPDGRAVTRFATSWATTPEQIAALAALLP